MYPVRSIQQGEQADFVGQLGIDPNMNLPLPFVPRRSFDRVAVIHGARVLGFERDRVVEVYANVVVGSRGAALIKEKSRIYVKQKTPRVGKARILGSRASVTWRAGRTSPYDCRTQRCGFRLSNHVAYLHGGLAFHLFPILGTLAFPLAHLTAAIEARDAAPPSYTRRLEGMTC